MIFQWSQHSFDRALLYSPLLLLTNYHLNQLFSTGANSVDLIGRPCLLCETQQLLACVLLVSLFLFNCAESTWVANSSTI